MKLIVGMVITEMTIRIMPFAAWQQKFDPPSHLATQSYCNLQPLCCFAHLLNYNDDIIKLDICYICVIMTMPVLWR